MSKRQLNRRQNWRIEKIQAERIARAQRREERAQEELEQGSLGHEQQGLVIAHFGVQIEVEACSSELAGQRFRCHLRANLPPLVTGDLVVWRAGQQGHGVVTACLPRSSELCRPDSRNQLKPVAANIDQIIIVFAPLPEPHANLIDRYLVAASHAGIRPLLLLNKKDLLADRRSHKAQQLLETYQQLGYRILAVSAETGAGLDLLCQRLKDNTSVFVGQSGVGKSSLINQLLPEANTAVGPLSGVTGKGTHTTTTARLFHFPGGGRLIDSPGIREFGLGHVGLDDIQAGFMEMQQFFGLCKFRDCSHEHEPGCALLQAVADGKISLPRLESFKQLVQHNAQQS